MTARYWDISPPIGAASPVWPGDLPPSRQQTLYLERGDSVELSALHTTVHVGAHADAPSHFYPNAPSIDQLDLDAYMGPAQVVTCLGLDAISAQELRENLKGVPACARILVRTEAGAPPCVFREEFRYFTPDAIDWLAASGVKLIGIDTPSVDAFASKDLPAHHRLLTHGLRNLEGLDLASVGDGKYELIALPLRLVGFDASPVRAILREWR